MLKFAIFVMTFGVLQQIVSSKEFVSLECTTDADCTVLGGAWANATCIPDHGCTCIHEDDTHVIYEMCELVRNEYTIKMPGQCGDCNLVDSYCNETTGYCVCKDGWRPSTKRRKCISASVPLGESCELDEQCYVYDHFSRCENQSCSCLEHFTSFQNKCRSIVEEQNGTTMTCKQDGDCSNRTFNTRCHEKKCICDPGFVANVDRNSCLPEVPYEGNCVERNQCVSRLGIGAMCDDGRCLCSKLFFPFPDPNHENITGTATKCQPRIIYGSTCNVDRDCFQTDLVPNEQLKVCFANTCICAIPHYENGDGKCFDLDHFSHRQQNSSTKNIPSTVVFIIVLFTIYFKQTI